MKKSKDSGENQVSDIEEKLVTVVKKNQKDKNDRYRE